MDWFQHQFTINDSENINIEEISKQLIEFKDFAIHEIERIHQSTPLELKDDIDSKTASMLLLAKKA